MNVTCDVTAAHVVLTDGEYVYDERNIAPVDLGWLNETAQVETGGELWWETACLEPVDTAVSHYLDQL